MPNKTPQRFSTPPIDADRREVDFADNIVRGKKLKPSGLLRVDAPVLFAHQSLVPLLPEFGREYSDIQLNLGIGNRMTDLIGEGIDCVIRSGNVQDLGLVARPFIRIELERSDLREFWRFANFVENPTACKTYAT